MAKKKATKKRVTKTAAKPKAKTKPDRTELALIAALRRHRGEKLTQAQSRDLAWYEKDRREIIIGETLVAIPKGLYCQMAGRQHKVVDDAAARYGLPIGKETVDLFDAIEAMHSLIADNARSIIPAGDAIITGDGEENEQVYFLKLAELQEKVKKLQVGNERNRIALTHDRGDSIDRRELRRILQSLTVKLKAFGQQLRRASSGIEAQKACNEFLERLAIEIESGDLVI